ncbi:MAG: hypothetical protein NVSMB68_01640 [Thermoanaerobaculia bacterium]
MKKTLAITLLSAASLFGQTVDEDYTKQIRQFTTGAQFMTELVDHLPSSATVPTPLKFLGYIAGAEGHLTYAEDVHRYMRALEAASPRVKVFSIGKTEEGREMILVAVSNEATIAVLDRYRDVTRRLSDPRNVTDADARQLIATGKPMYYATGAMHSPETGSPEMLMELAYRLAVEETSFVRNIRNNVIVLITPVLEVDGRDRMVDLWHYREKNPALPTPPLVYWGHYVAHDNNRDNLGLALDLSRNVMKAYYDFHPQVIHDLHESVPFLYISTGTGPYNPALDPLMIDEWHRMAYGEVNKLTERGLPGAWTHGFYDGWAPNYMIWIGMGHNSVGRFYETFGNRWPTTENRIVRGASTREWFRPNPPLPQVKWSLRNNINYQESALLFALSDMASNREHFLEQFWTLGKRSVAKATTEGPAAYVFPADGKRPGNLAQLLDLLTQHGIEIHSLDQPFTSGKTTYPKSSWVVRMDQPYSRLADAMLDVQYVRPEDRVYDDTGWTLGYQKNVDFTRVTDVAILKAAMHRVPPPTTAASAAETRGATPNHSDIAFLRTAISGKQPRIAILHTWQSTQKEGWYRLALENLGAKYDYISTQVASRSANLHERYDVIIFPPAGASSQDIVNGLPPGPPLPWKKTELTPNLTIDQTDDMRPGLGLSGVANLQRFVEDGGLLVTAEDTTEWAIDYGLARWVKTVPAKKLRAPGTIIRSEVTDRKSPISAGYDSAIPVYYSASVILKVGLRDESRDEPRTSGRGTKTDADVPQGRVPVATPERPKAAPGEEGFQPPEDLPGNFSAYMPRPEDRPMTIVSFAKKADDLLMSGMLDGGEEIAGTPALVDSPRGKGHILLFAFNPMWRMNTQGTYALLMNAVLNWDHLR